VGGKTQIRGLFVPTSPYPSPKKHSLKRGEKCPKRLCFSLLDPFNTLPIPFSAFVPRKIKVLVLGNQIKKRGERC